MNPHQNPLVAEQKRMNARRVRAVSIVMFVCGVIWFFSALLGVALDTDSLMLVAFFAYAVAAFSVFGVIGTGVARIGAGASQQLDPIEKNVRLRAYALSYRIFTLVVAGVLAVAALTPLFGSSIADWFDGDPTPWVLSGTLLLIGNIFLPTFVTAWTLPLTEIYESDS